jgi:hypothetical protein
LVAVCVGWSALVAAGGCSGDAAIRAWQRSLEEYVTDQGNGDPNVLRAVAEDPSASDFGLIGARSSGVLFVFPARTDVAGLLIGHRRLADRAWFIYVVGAVKYRGTLSNFPLDDEELRDLRPAAFSAHGGRYEWRLGERDEEAMRLYCRPQLEAWRRSDPSRENASEAPTTFPTPADDWRVETTDETISVTDAHSGVSWSIPIPASEK